MEKYLFQPNAEEMAKNQKQDIQLAQLVTSVLPNYGKIEIYTEPALENAQTTTLSEADCQALKEENIALNVRVDDERLAKEYAQIELERYKPIIDEVKKIAANLTEQIENLTARLETAEIAEKKLEEFKPFIEAVEKYKNQ